jgi:hypothetical protein
MNIHSVKCIRQPAFRDMIVGEVYNYTVGELAVEYWLAGEGFPVKAHMPIYAWASAVHVGELIPLSDLPEDEEE